MTTEAKPIKTTINHPADPPPINLTLSELTALWDELQTRPSDRSLAFFTALEKVRNALPKELA